MKHNKIVLTLILICICVISNAQTSVTIAELEIQKSKASADENYKLAAELKLKIQELKDKEITELANAKILEEQKKKSDEETALKEKQAADLQQKNEEEARQKEKLVEEQRKKAEVEEFKREVEESANKKREEDAALLREKQAAEQVLLKEKQAADQKQKTEELALLKEKQLIEQKQKAEEQATMKAKLDAELKIKAEEQLLEKEIALAELKFKKDLDVEVKELESQIAKAVAAENYLQADDLKVKTLKVKADAEIQKTQIGQDIRNKKENDRLIENLEKEKSQAIAETNYKLAEELKVKINNLKENKTVTNTIEVAKPAVNEKYAKDIQIEKLEKEKTKAIADANFKLAEEIKQKILALKTSEIQLSSSVDSKITEKSANEIELEKLEAEKVKAVAAANYTLAGELSKKIKVLKAASEKALAEAKKKAELDAKISELEKEKDRAVLEANYALAGEINKKIKNLKFPPQVASSSVSGAKKSSGLTTVPGQSTIMGSNNNKSRISKSEENSSSGIKYRRSSLYTLMVNNTSRDYANVIENAFVNTAIPDKFNNHNLTHATIDVTSNSSNILSDLDRYLRTNNIAKELVAKWFNRDERGLFNTRLVEQRGAYNASNIDLNIAQSSARGLALLSDAGEELIGSTYVVINEFRYTNKEEVANKTKAGISLLAGIASLVPGAPDLTTAATVANVGLTVAGKGYTIKTNSYLYQLVWNDEIATTFYRDYYIDESSYDENKINAFNNSNLFQLKYVGLESAWADLQSNIFTNKSNEQLISKATGKAVDAGISKLQRKFEAFRTKTPIFSVNPVTAKIGLKEGLQAGDRFEVLEQVQDETGKLTYKRKGIITVDGRDIWDNTNTIEELQEAGKSSYANQFTTFRGAGDFFPGMLIRQIN